MVVPRNESLISYLKNMISQVRSISRFSLLFLLGWLETNDLHSLVIVIYGLDSQKVLERWTFAVETDQEVAQSNGTMYFFFLYSFINIEQKRRISI